jgi:hypothetical protein
MLPQQQQQQRGAKVKQRQLNLKFKVLRANGKKSIYFTVI